MSVKDAVRKITPRPALRLYRFLRDDAAALLNFITAGDLRLPRAKRIALCAQLYSISDQIECPHIQSEVIAFIRTILGLNEAVPGCVVEAGAFKGGSTAKFSLAARYAGRKLYVFDSFEGIPPNDEPHDKSITGFDVKFPAGSYRGGLDEVRSNLARCGAPEVCELVPGWFADTLPRFHEIVAAAYLDVDLASSTRTCIKHLYPLLSPGGALYSQDGHLPLVLDVFNDDALWRDLGTVKPKIEGFGESKLLRVVKPQFGTPISTVSSLNSWSNV